MSEIVRLIRILEYIGPRDHIEATMKNNPVTRTPTQFGATVMTEVAAAVTSWHGTIPAPVEPGQSTQTNQETKNG